MPERMTQFLRSESGEAAAGSIGARTSLAREQSKASASITCSRVCYVTVPVEITNPRYLQQIWQLR